MRTQFAGTDYTSMRQAAVAWAATALPDTSVIGAGEVPAEAAAEIEAYWVGEAAKIGEGAPEGVDEDAWRAACRAALVERIEQSRA